MVTGQCWYAEVKVAGKIRAGRPRLCSSNKGVNWFEAESGEAREILTSQQLRATAGHAPERGLWGRGRSRYHKGLWLEGPEVHEIAGLSTALPLLRVRFWGVAPLRDRRNSCIWLMGAAMTPLNGLN